MIFDLVPRIAIGSIIAYIIGQHIDVFIFSMIKRYLALIRPFIRAYGSTILSSIIDTGLFVSIAFIGTMPGTAVLKYLLPLTC